MMSVLDHLATPAEYGPYLSQYTKKKFACKAGLTPDSLLDIKVRKRWCGIGPCSNIYLQVFYQQQQQLYHS